MTSLTPHSNSYSWRSLRYEDLPALRALFLAAADADGSDRVDTLADLQTQFADPWSDPEADARIAAPAEPDGALAAPDGALAAPDGALAAFARCFVNPQPEHEAVAHLWSEVHPQHRGCGLEDAALDWLEARAAERLRTAPAGLPRSMRVGTQDTLADQIARFERRGFAPVRYFYRMRRDLRRPIPDHRLPEAFTLRRYGPDVDQTLLDAHNEAFSDHWSYEAVTREDWEQFFTGSENFRPEFTLIALDGGQVAAYSVNRVHAQDNARLGVSEGHIGQLGTRRAWRKRGLASALLCESMRLFREAGFERVSLGVDAENPTGALGLYERLGFETVKRFVVYGKPVPA